MKEWTIELYVLDEQGKERPAKCFTKVTYNLHPSFEQPTQSRHSLFDIIRPELTR
jgi:transcription initiation factor IIF auxiliary subunit